MSIDRADAIAAALTAGPVRWEREHILGHGERGWLAGGDAWDITVRYQIDGAVWVEHEHHWSDLGYGRGRNDFSASATVESIVMQAHRMVVTLTSIALDRARQQWATANGTPAAGARQICPTEFLPMLARLTKDARSPEPCSSGEVETTPTPEEHQ